MPITGSHGSASSTKRGTRRFKAVGSTWCLLVAFAFVIFSDRASTQLVEVPTTWGGDILSRPRLTGDWDGLRDDLGKKGIVLDVDLLLTPQVVMGGGRNTGGSFWGNLDYTLNVDTQKLGLWPGGFVTVSADTGFGSNAFQDAGTIVPVNTTALLPAPDDRTTALTNANLTQFFSPQFAVTAGKFNLLDAGRTEFYGDYRTQFLNTAFNFPMTLALLPLSTFGGGVVVVPRDDIILSGLAIGPNGEPTSNDVSQAFHGVLILGNGKLTVKPFGLIGHQSLGFTWNNQNRFSLDQNPSNIADLLLTQRFPLLANPGPVLTQILANRFPNLLSQPNPPTARTAAGRSAIASISISGSPMVIRSTGLVSSSRSGLRTGTRTRSSMPISPALAAREWCRAAPTTASASASPGPSSAIVSFPFCDSSSTSACNARMRSRCTTTWRSHRG